MRINCELNADVDPGTTVVVSSDFAFEPETVLHRPVAARTNAFGATVTITSSTNIL